ncbi:MAG: DUF3147 family protein [Baekduia sp.]
MYFLLKALISGLLVAGASEAARRSSLVGAILISLPLTSILAILWLYRDTRDPDEIAAFSWSVLWVVLPSVVFFVVLPLAIRAGAGVIASLLLAGAATAAGYAVWVWAARRLGLDL